MKSIYYNILSQYEKYTIKIIERKVILIDV